MLNNDHGQNDGIMGLIYNVYSEFIEQIVGYSNIQERAILALTNEDVVGSMILC